MSTTTTRYDPDVSPAEATGLLHEEREGETVSELDSTELDRSGYWSLLLLHVSR